MSPRSQPLRTAPHSRPDERFRQEVGGRRPPARSPLPPGPRMAPPQDRRSQERSRVPQERTNATRAYTSSSSSVSSSSSLFLDRMKVRGGTSSRTSLEEEEEDASKRRGGGWAPGQNRRPLVQEEQYEEAEVFQDSTPVQQTSGYGYDLWGRVTAVASNLTVNVSKAWERGVHIADGEETPPGQESRLTKAMKAYHLDRAKTPADLPAWLFDEQERGVAPRSWRAAKTEEQEEHFRADADLPRQQRGGLRDIYDRAAAHPYAPGKGLTSQAANNDASSSRATNRLKAIRDAKRSALQTGSDNIVEDPRAQDHSPESSGRRTAPVRVGLPAGPGRIRR